MLKGQAQGRQQQQRGLIEASSPYAPTIRNEFFWYVDDKKKSGAISRTTRSVIMLIAIALYKWWIKAQQSNKKNKNFQPSKLLRQILVRFLPKSLQENFQQVVQKMRLFLGRQPQIDNHSNNHSNTGIYLREEEEEQEEEIETFEGQRQSTYQIFSEKLYIQWVYQAVKNFVKKAVNTLQQQQQLLLSSWPSSRGISLSATNQELEIEDAQNHELIEKEEQTNENGHHHPAPDDIMQTRQEEIQSVLLYWFGQYPPELSNKKLWMIASSSVEHRKRIDAEITDTFQTLLQWLIQEQKIHSRDVPVSDNDQESQASSAIYNYHLWCQSQHTYMGKLAAIVVLDQFSRHIHRHYEEQEKQREQEDRQQGEQEPQQDGQRAISSTSITTPLSPSSSITTTTTTSTTTDAKTSQNDAERAPASPVPLSQEEEEMDQDSLSLPDQKILDIMAFEIATLFFQEHDAEVKSGMIPLPMVIFALMPFRHQERVTTVQNVQSFIDVMANLQNHHSMPLLQRFRKATNRRMAVLQDHARRTGDKVVNHNDKNALFDRQQDDNTNNKLLFDDTDILEVFPFDADMSKAPNHIVTKTVRQFCEKHALTPLTPTIVSLSGGVDSMVLASILSQQLNFKYVYAIHIDYANRPESNAEAVYVEKYCQSLGIIYRVRRITEVTRGVTARDAYERIAREARYNMYRATVREAMEVASELVGYQGKITATTSATTTTIGVMLGHHRGDLRENVLSNAHKGCGPLDLSGMTPISRNDGVTIFRPLLPLEKDVVYDYAHTFGIPYFKDTTPHWSTRGKLRNKLLPLLEEIYGDGSMGNLSTLATESDEARHVLHDAVLAPFLDQVQHKPMGIYFDTHTWKDQGLFFWKFVLREALHGAGLGMFSDKSVEAFMGRIQAAHPLKEGWLQCRKDYAVYLNQYGRVYVFYPQSFPFRKAEQYSTQNYPISIGKDAIVGPWIIHVSLPDHNDDEVVTMASNRNAATEKALKSWEHFMEGDIAYLLEVPRYDRDNLQFVVDFNKQSRPPAWRGVDLKIQSTLPLVGNNSAALNLLSNGAATSQVLVTLRLRTERITRAS